MICGITGHKGVLGSNFIKNYKTIKFIKYNGDICNKKNITKWILKKNFEYFLHFAAIVPIKKVKKNYKLARKTNYKAVKYIVDALKKKNIPIWFFFASTSHVYGFSDKRFNESCKTRPINKYGRLKLLAEKYVRSILKNTKVTFCIGRIFSYTSILQSSNFFIPSIFKRKTIDKNYMKKINTLRDFIDLRDVCSAIRFLMKNKSMGIFNIASGEAINLQKILVKINKNNKKFLLNKIPKNNILADITKINNIGWHPRYRISRIIEKFIKKFSHAS